MRRSVAELAVSGQAGCITSRFARGEDLRQGTGMRTLALGVFLAALGAGAANAVCPSRDVLFQDSFDALKPTWGNPTDAVNVANGQLVLTPPSGTYSWIANNAGLYDDLDMCVTVTTVKGVDPVNAIAGIVFWYMDVNDFYALEIAPNGKSSVWRRQRGKWLAQIAWADAQVNMGDGATNELRVTTVGNNATFYLNGTKFNTLSGTPPDKGQQIGLMAVSPETGTASFAFDDLRVTKP
jgi:hypothetical protein